MSTSDWIAFIVGGLTIMLNLIGFAVGYGMVRGTVNALDARVKALETEMKAVTALDVKVTKVETAMGFILEQLRDLNSSIRWMRDPALPHQPQP